MNSLMSKQLQEKKRLPENLKQETQRGKFILQILHYNRKRRINYGKRKNHESIFTK